MRTRTRILLALAASLMLAFALAPSTLWGQSPRPPQAAVAAIAPTPAAAPQAPVVATTPPPAVPQIPPPQAGRPPQPPMPATAPQAPAPARDAGQQANVKVDVTIADQTGTAPAFKKSISVTVADRQGGMIRSSINIPTPSTTFQATTDKGPASPMTSWTYRSANLNLDVRDCAIDGNFIRLRLVIEFSPVDEKMVDVEVKPGGPGPSFANFQQTLSLVLENGKPMQVAQSSDAVPSRDRKLTVDVKATILK